MRDRFSPEIRELIEKSKWWEYKPTEFSLNLPLFFESIDLDGAKQLAMINRGAIRCQRYQILRFPLVYPNVLHSWRCTCLCEFFRRFINEEEESGRKRNR